MKFTNIKKDLINSIIILVALMFFGLILSSLSVFFFPKDAYSLGAKIDIIRTLPLPFLLYLFIVRVFAEEIFFRGLLTNKIGIFFSSVVFGIMHAGYFSFLEIFGAFALGLVLAYFYKKNGTLVPNIVAHIIYNLTVLFFLTF
ncbi:MAG: type II CAAX endopeptidase family protein [Candidatus Diapherotrites archaeon]|nr:type II CAAX endopeptidase family protein [Candidatus Diapherotrites archaeon]